MQRVQLEVWPAPSLAACSSPFLILVGKAVTSALLSRLCRLRLHSSHALKGNASLGTDALPCERD